MNDIFIRDKAQMQVCFHRDSFKDHLGAHGLKYYLIVMYMRKHLQEIGEIQITLDLLLEECGYLTKTRNKNIYFDFRRIIKEEIIDKGYASCNVEIMSVRPSKVFTLKLNSNRNLFLLKDNYVLCSVEEYDKITKPEVDINNSILLGTYLFIKSFIRNSLTSQRKISYPSEQQIKK